MDQKESSPITYTIRTTNRETGEVTEETRRAVIRLSPSGLDAETSKVRVSVRDGGPRVARILADTVRPFNLNWMAGAEAWDTKGAWSDERTHQRIAEVLQAAGFEVDDELATTKAQIEQLRAEYRSSVPVIRSIELYPHHGGVVYPSLSHGKGFTSVGPAWPPLHVGQIVEVHDTQGWKWTVRIDDLGQPGQSPSIAIGPDRPKATVIGEKEALPMPPLTRHPDGTASIRLPNVSGHAHLRSWRTGDLVEIEGETWKVRAPKKLEPAGRLFHLTPATAEQFANRPGRVRLSGEAEALRAVGSAVQTPSGEWLHIKEAKHQTHRDQEDGTAYGRTYYGIGSHVTAAKAEKINAAHPPAISRDLYNAPSVRTDESMPASAAVLVPKDPRSLAATGERVAIVDGKVLHERTGDPDMSDSWRHYVVQVEADADLKKRVAALIKRA